MASITVRPNQSLLDVVLQGCGTLEAAMQLAADNGMAISDVPVVGGVLVVSAAATALGDTGVLKYLGQNAIVVGTYGAPEAYDILTDEDGGNDYTDEDGDTLTSN